MKNTLAALSMVAVAAAAAPALAERWTTPVNGTVSALPMPDGSVMMRIQLPQTVYGMISRDMREQHTGCTIKALDASSPDTMIVDCGG